MSQLNPHIDYTIGFAEVIDTAHSLIEAGGMTAREETFVIQMQQAATRLREEFHMSVKQARWWRSIVDISGVVADRRWKA